MSVISSEWAWVGLWVFIKLRRIWREVVFASGCWRSSSNADVDAVVLSFNPAAAVDDDDDDGGGWDSPWRAMISESTSVFLIAR